MTNETADRLLTTAKVVECSGLHRATVYRKVKDGSFPPPVQIGPRRVAWRERDIVNWQRSLPVGVKVIA